MFDVMMPLLVIRRELRRIEPSPITDSESEGKRSKRALELERTYRELTACLCRRCDFVLERGLSVTEITKPLDVLRLQYGIVILALCR